jgi:hypothetical protein
MMITTPKLHVHRVASVDELRITHAGDHAILAHADPSLMTPELEIDAAKLAAMRAAELVEYWNEHAAPPVAGQSETREPLADSGTEPALRGGASTSESATAVEAPEPAPTRAPSSRRRHKRLASAVERSGSAREIAAPAPPSTAGRERELPPRPAPRAKPLASTRGIAPALRGAEITPRSDDLERRFRALALEIGLARAELLLQRVRVLAKHLAG